jgi:UPF0755 protein
MTPRRRRRYYLPIGCVGPLALLCVALAAAIGIPVIAARTFGPAADGLGPWQRVQYSALLLWYDGQVSRPLAVQGGDQPFTISAGEGVVSVANRLEQAGLVASSDAFRTYLVYSGLDTSMQAGQFTLSPALSAMQIAQRLQDATPQQLKFVVLPGWRTEEIAASLPTSGLNFTAAQFMAAAGDPRDRFDYMPAGVSAEGFLFPDQYTLPRGIQADQLVALLMNHFDVALAPELRDGFVKQGLTIYQAVTLASIVQREALQDDEQPVIASVFLNRIAAGMHLETDPTIQYALGFDVVTNSWWRSPLSLDDLKVVSPYNTYSNAGLPPGPISNPSLTALRAVAFPAVTPYLYFRARCDGSGRHAFAKTFDEQMNNACP